MNCKPGDLAIVIRGPITGKLVEVLRAAPVGIVFRLPDGHRHEACEIGYWVLKILGTPVHGLPGWPPERFAQYGCGGDSGLRPIKGLPVDETIDEEITA